MGILPQTETTVNPLVPVTIVGAFACGMCIVLVGTIKVPLVRQLGISELRVGLLVAALNLALILMMLVSGMLVDSWGVAHVLTLGSILAAVGLASLGVSRTYRATVGSILVMGAGTAFVSTGCTVLMPEAFDPNNPTASTNFGNVFFGLGAVITTLLVEPLLRKPEKFRTTMLILGFFALVPALVSLTTSSSLFPPRIANRFGLEELLQSHSLWLAGLVFFLYLPLENVLGTWATTYLAEQGHSERQSAQLLAGFWVAFLLSRLAAAGLQEYGIIPLRWEPALIVALALASAVVLGNLAGASRFTNSGWGIIALGALLGPIFPTLTGMVLGDFTNERGTAFGTMFAIGASGSLLLVPAIGFSARRTGVQHALRIPMVVALLLAAAALVLGLLRSTR